MVAWRVLWCCVWGPWRELVAWRVLWCCVWGPLFHFGRDCDLAHIPIRTRVVWCVETTPVAVFGPAGMAV